MPPEGFIGFRWKTRRHKDYTEHLCPRCGTSGSAWGGPDNAGLQVEGGRNLTFAQIDGSLVRKYRLGRRPFDTCGNIAGECRRWSGGECAQCGLKYWEDLLGGVRGAYAERNKIKAGRYFPAETDILGRIVEKKKPGGRE